MATVFKWIAVIVGLILVVCIALLVDVVIVLGV